MTLGSFAVAVAAPAKWVQNAHAVLRLEPRYTDDRARVLALARILEQAFDIPLTRAYAMARQTLKRPDSPASWRHESLDGAAAIVVDRERFLSTFTVNSSLAREWYAARRRGRPRQRRHRGVAAAKRHGIDTDLLVESLRRTAAARLRRLDEDVAFLHTLKVPSR